MTHTSTPKGDTRVDELVNGLKLQPHPERGYYVESYRAKSSVSASTHPGPRSASTAIYFLVEATQPATYLHRLRSDEVFHLYEGGPLEILRLFPDGTWDVAVLGLDLQRGQRPQIAIEAGTVFGTELAEGASHCLVGCTVAPGFDFEDFELTDDTQLETTYHEVRDRIQRMARPKTRS